LPKHLFVGENRVASLRRTGGVPVNFWLWVIGWIAASAVVVFGLSINGKTESGDAPEGGHGHGHH